MENPRIGISGKGLRNFQITGFVLEGVDSILGKAENVGYQCYLIFHLYYLLTLYQMEKF